MNNHKITLSADSKTDMQLSAIIEKYSREGKDVSSYLEKLLQEKNLDYTDYLNLDTLLTLQKPKTPQPDEIIFITYHQIVELYFSLIIQELKQLTSNTSSLTGEIFYDKINRVNKYLQLVIDSFPVILSGLDKVQFQKFRHALFPASGFQSYQFRQIEFYLSDLKNLVPYRGRSEITDEKDTPFIFERLYWKKGMINPITRKKGITLIDFENRYNDLLLDHAYSYQHRNVSQIFNQYFRNDPMVAEIIPAMKKLDNLFNIQWAGLHYRVAMKHLTSNGNTKIKSTGSTHWRKYLHPKFQKIIFFPQILNEEEIADWGNSIH